MVQSRLTDYWQPLRQEALQPNVDENLEINKKVNILQLNVCSLSEIKANLLYQISVAHDVSVLCLSELGHRRAIPSF